MSIRGSTAKALLIGRKDAAGRPTDEERLARRRARENMQRLLAGQQQRSLAVLIAIRDNPKAEDSDRIRCCIEIMDRGEHPKKTANYHGIGDMDQLEAAFEFPKIFVTEKYTNGNGHGPAEPTPDEPTGG